jgi:hypothetical protein
MQCIRLVPAMVRHRIPIYEHSEIEVTVYKEISDYILSAGTFGFYRKDKYASIRRKFNVGHNGEEELKSAAGGKREYYRQPDVMSKMGL